MQVLSKTGFAIAIVVGGLFSGFTEADSQCAMARRLGGAENFRRHPRIKIDTGAFPNDGDELGSIWVVGASAFNSGGPHFPNEDRCPSSGERGWWQSGTRFLGTDSGIQAFVSSPSCLFTNCPPRDSSLITLLEDQSADGADAAFIAYLVDESPAGRRWYDHARSEPMEPERVTTHTLKAYPRPVIVVEPATPDSSGFGLRLEDFAGHAHVVRGADNVRQSEGEAILTFDLLSATGGRDPGRRREAWTLAARLPFADVGQRAFTLEQALCATPDDRRWFAVGATFVDGVESRLVGRALQVDCARIRSGGER